MNMRTSKFKRVIYAIGIGLFFSQGFLNTACSDWTEMEAENYYESPTKSYYENLQDYFKSPHKIMFGWFGNWSGKSSTSMQYALCGLPDSVDFVSLWGIKGNLTEAQKTDLRDFQAKGSKAVFCWRIGNIGTGLTPAGENTEEFWGINPDDETSYIAAAQKYALAIVDSCNKYNVDGFDYDVEDWGSLLSKEHPERVNAFMRTLREEFDKTGKLLIIDIPGQTTALGYYNIFETDVIQSLDYIIWQTYDQSISGLDAFFTGNSGVSSYHQPIFEEVMKKSIITATFEEAVHKQTFTVHQNYHPSCGIQHAGMGAYHIEYDYPGNPDYPMVRAAISAQNPPINK